MQGVEYSKPKAGLMILLMGPQAQPIPTTIKKVQSDIVTIDLNHLMVDKMSIFKVKIDETGYGLSITQIYGYRYLHDHDH